MRSVDLIVLHCSATPNGRRTTVEDVDGWHVERGFKRASDWRAYFNPKLRAVGYHFVIRPNGALDTGRHLDEIGAHVRGHNASSVGICMAGTDRFTLVQWAQLRSTVTALLKRYPAVRVCGHRDLDPHKTCPGFDVAAWFAAGMAAPSDHVLEPAA